MATSKSKQYWLIIVIILIAIIAVGSVVIWSRYRTSQPIEISIKPSQELQGEIYVGGAVTNPGFYSLEARDSIGTLIQAAGGTAIGADLTRLSLYISRIAGEEQAQKVDINRAEAWLLEALPGIGEVRAKAITDYRHQNGLFRNINEITKVEGIGATTYDRIKDLITVAD